MYLVNFTYIITAASGFNWVSQTKGKISDNPTDQRERRRPSMVKQEPTEQQETSEERQQPLIKMGIRIKKLRRDMREIKSSMAVINHLRQDMENLIAFVHNANTLNIVSLHFFQSPLSNQQISHSLTSLPRSHSQCILLVL